MVHDKKACRSYKDVNEKLEKIAREAVAFAKTGPLPVRQAAIAYFIKRTELTRETATYYVDRILNSRL